MATLIQRTELQMAAAELLALDGIRGTRLRCVEGSVWLTLDGDPRDVFLHPGDDFVVDRGGATLLHALAPTRLEVVRQDAVPLAPAGRWRGALAHLARRLYAALSPSRLAGT